MSSEHNYNVTIKWTGYSGSGTSDYKSYERSHEIFIDQKPVLYGSSDPAFRGDKNRHNPEDLLVSSLASCHMLWYLHLCAINKIIVVDYVDHALGVMSENSEGLGSFTEVVLQPVVTITADNMVSLAAELHIQANKMCFIANSVNFPVKHKPLIQVLD